VIDLSKRVDAIRYLTTLTECRALQTKAEGEAATEVVKLLGLPSHHDAQKNWDCLKAVACVVGLGDLATPVLDAGSGDGCVAARWLRTIGFERVHACDLKPADKAALAAVGIATPYPSGHFQAVTCISVIEHNVPLAAFAAEMARILRPGGLLLVSTDYWSEPIDCTGIYPYGREAGEMKVFQADEIEGFVSVAGEAGLEPCDVFQPETRDRAVRWDRVDREYTFAFLALRKSAG
jgi:SAM-dependent methyltransferase